MQYSGGKFRQSKTFVPIINKIRNNYEYYVDPFCGGCNVIDKIGGKRIASDIHSELIIMWEALQGGWIPPTDITEDQYNRIKNNKDHYQPELVAFVGFCSFGAKYWCGYPRSKNRPSKFSNVSRSLLKQLPLIKDVEFYNCSYDELDIPQNSLIYCDPPYKSAKTVKYNVSFDYEKFYNWCRKQSKNHVILISEYQMPDDFIEVGRHTSAISIHKNNKYQTDVLYCHKSQVHLFDIKI